MSVYFDDLKAKYYHKKIRSYPFGKMSETDFIKVRNYFKELFKIIDKYEYDEAIKSNYIAFLEENGKHEEVIEVGEILVNKFFHGVLDYNEHVMQALKTLSTAYYYSNMYEKYLEVNNEIIKNQDLNTDDIDKHVISAYVNISLSLIKLKRYEECLRVLFEAKQYLEARYEETDYYLTSYMKILNQLVYAYSLLDNLDKTLYYLQVTREYIYSTKSWQDNSNYLNLLISNELKYVSVSKDHSEEQYSKATLTFYEILTNHKKDIASISVFNNIRDIVIELNKVNKVSYIKYKDLYIKKEVCDFDEFDLDSIISFAYVEHYIEKYDVVNILIKKAIKVFENLKKDSLFEKKSLSTLFDLLYESADDEDYKEYIEYDIDVKLAIIREILDSDLSNELDVELASLCLSLFNIYTKINKKEEAHIFAYQSIDYYNKDDAYHPPKGLLDAIKFELEYYTESNYKSHTHSEIRNCFKVMELIDEIKDLHENNPFDIDYNNDLRTEFDKFKSIDDRVLIEELNHIYKMFYNIFYKIKYYRHSYDCYVKYLFTEHLLNRFDSMESETILNITNCLYYSNQYTKTIDYASYLLDKGDEYEELYLTKEYDDALYEVGVLARKSIAKLDEEENDIS